MSALKHRQVSGALSPCAVPDSPPSYRRRGKNGSTGAPFRGVSGKAGSYQTTHFWH